MLHIIMDYIGVANIRKDKRSRIVLVNMEKQTKTGKLDGTIFDGITRIVLKNMTNEYVSIES